MLSAAGDLEFVAYGLQNVPPDLPAQPGAAHYAGGDPVLLHVAPGRWFAPAADAALRDALLAHGDSGTVVDVDGNWRRINVTGADADAVLGATIDIAAVLDGRDCASVLLFDCPARVARLSDGYAVWVRASYQPHLQRELVRVSGG
jgi:heterotetrameric sarcosine oxidase gamma subunit